MSIAGLTAGASGQHGSIHPRQRNARRTPWRTLVVAAASVATVVATGGTSADAAIVPTVGLGTAAQYAVLGGSTVTNTGNSVMDASLGLWPGSSITGFPPGLVNAPGTIENTTAAALQAQTDLTTAYNDAAGRSLDATTPADLVNQQLVGGVYAGPNKSPLSLSGPLVLDGAGDPSSVFIFQTDSTLTTASSSTVTLINGAQECNVFWLVGSSATLGTSSVFVGTILALESITVTTGVTVHGRALARNAAVTLDNDRFVLPTCAVTPTPGSTIPGSATTAPAGPGGVATTAPSVPGTGPGGVATTAPGITAAGDTSTTGVADTIVGDTSNGASTVPPSFPGVTLPRTGPADFTGTTFLVGLTTLGAGLAITLIARRRPLVR